VLPEGAVRINCANIALRRIARQVSRHAFRWPEAPTWPIEKARGLLARPRYTRAERRFNGANRTQPLGFCRTSVRSTLSARIRTRREREREREREAVAGSRITSRIRVTLAGDPLLSRIANDRFGIGGSFRFVCTVPSA